ncbi:MAG: hypothetical protein JW808_01490 [Victivallales bacterium]|nr:hypothetical protein [Victivallales bacterium]
MKRTVAICVFALQFICAYPGTIIFHDGTTISDVDIVSISDGQVVIEKDKARRSYPLGKIKSYYGTDLPESVGDVMGEYAEYGISVLDIKAPDKGVDSKNKTAEIEVEYSISRKDSNPKIKVPYFYLYVLTPGKDEVSGRQVHTYTYPKQAKGGKKGYDEVAIMKDLADFGRPVWHAAEHNLKGKISGRKISFSLKGIGKRDILAWHIEVWGNKDKIYEKTEKVMHLDRRAAIGENWWKRLQHD